jgi:hypothetical protein
MGRKRNRGRLARKARGMKRTSRGSQKTNIVKNKPMGRGRGTVPKATKRPRRMSAYGRRGRR